MRFSRLRLRLSLSHLRHVRSSRLSLRRMRGRRGRLVVTCFPGLIDFVAGLGFHLPCLGMMPYGIHQQKRNGLGGSRLASGERGSCMTAGISPRPLAKGQLRID